VALRETDVLTANYLADEGIEAVRSMRDESFAVNISTQSVGTPYHLIFNGTDWDFTTAPQTIDGKFARTVIIDQVRRNASDSDIANPASAEPIDPETKKITVEVAWDSDSRTIVTYITDLFDN
jgi:hypothetical protein